MTANFPLKFRVRVSPDWQALHPVIKERASKLGFNWPATSHPARFPRVYTVTLTGQVEDSKLLYLDASALEPPKETVVASGLKAWDALVVTFKVAGKRAFAEASPQAKAAPDVLAVHLDAHGLYLPKVSEAGLTDQRLVEIPLPKLVQGFADLLLGKASIKRTGVDHIVERYSSLPELETFQVSKWRGDGFYRLAAPWVRVEISVDPTTRA